MPSPNMLGLNLWKIKKLEQFFHDFIEIVNESNQKLNKLWLDQGKKFYNKFMQKWLNHNNSLMYFTHNESKQVVAESFIRTLIDFLLNLD